MENEGNKPVKKFKAGGISAAVWKNKTKLKDGKEIENLSVTVERRYKDSNDEWKNSSSLRLNDVPKAQLVLGKAYEFMAMKSLEDNNGVVEEEVLQ